MRVLSILAIAAAIVLLAGCRVDEQAYSEATDAGPVAETAESIQTPEEGGEASTVQNIEMIVSGKAFSVTMLDTESSRALVERLPMQIEMQELNGNEKYHYLEKSLPAAEESPSTIHTGDLMLFGTDCLVLFYKDFSTSYSYTPLGYVTNPEGLAQALGKGNVSITFQNISE